jgi:isopentenyl phosphate kinase
MKNLILIKLGGSVVTDKAKPFCARPAVIKRLALEIKKAKNLLKNTNLIVGHGSGSFGHTIAAKYRTQKGIINKNSLRGFCLTSETAVDINRIVLKEFLKAGLPVVSFSPMSFVYPNNIFLRPIKKSLDLGFVPLIYGDVVFDTVKGFTIYSCEKTLDILAEKLSKKYQKTRVVQCGDTDGVYGLNGQTISNITPKNFKLVKKWITGSKSTDVTGGMIHKVGESLNLAKKLNIKTSIINGNKKGTLLKAILGKKVISTVIGS